MADFSDPRTGYDPVDELSLLAEQADAAFGTAVDDLAVAENAEDRAFHLALIESEATSAAGREQYARAQTVEERAVRRIKEAAAKSAQNHSRTCLARLSAAQTKYRSVDRLAG